MPNTDPAPPPCRPVLRYNKNADGSADYTLAHTIMAGMCWVAAIATMLLSCRVPPGYLKGQDSLLGRVASKAYVESAEGDASTPLLAGSPQKARRSVVEG